MCGGQSTSTQQVSIPPEVLAQYANVNAKANTVADQPFQQYSTDPNSFVAPLNATQQAGISNTNAAVGQAQPYFDAATGYLQGAQGVGQAYTGMANQDLAQAQGTGNALGGMSLSTLLNAYQQAQPYNQVAGQYYTNAYSGAQPLNQTALMQYGAGLSAAQPYNQVATQLGLGAAGPVNAQQIGPGQINQFLSPYLSTVLGSEAGLLNQQNQQQQSGQMGQAMQQGAFGGDRGGIAAANLAQTQQLANAKIYSDILNQGYGQALGAAQQQQGVNLGAAQANRAALSGAAGQLAGLGQQQYGQYTGTGSAVQGLGGQLFQQGAATGQSQQGLGQQIYSQGANTAAQEAALGQQQFGQGMSVAQQQAALGQQAYGMGANTSQGLANLGQGAQAASLQGAQAQLGAGQVAQQTQQAGQTALYNQFLQQQSYPFQVAQFLANIAEGTGSLSGSTTTTTQPGGFFSDKRLKEDAKEIGKTFDGQPIYSFKYKGDDKRTTIGLMAQDVEKSHPEAVGLAGGFKTVDYGKATHDAAKRGHFADGGGIGFDPQMMQEILANQAGAFGPYLTAASGVNPYGSSGRVPAATLPVGQLKVAPDLPKQDSPMAEFNAAMKSAEALPDTISKAKADYNSLFNKKTDAASGSAADDGAAQGGAIHYAAGGVIPYEDQKAQVPGQGLDIPNDDPAQHHLTTPGQLPGQKSGLGQIGDAANTVGSIASAAATVAKFLPMIGLAAGGSVRKGYAGDGSVNDDNDYNAGLEPYDDTPPPKRLVVLPLAPADDKQAPPNAFQEKYNKGAPGNVDLGNVLGDIPGDWARLTGVVPSEGPNIDAYDMMRPNARLTDPNARGPITSSNGTKTTAAKAWAAKGLDPSLAGNPDSEVGGSGVLRHPGVGLAPVIDHRIVAATPHNARAAAYEPIVAAPPSPIPMSGVVPHGSPLDNSQGDFPTTPISGPAQGAMNANPDNRFGDYPADQVGAPPPAQSAPTAGLGAAAPGDTLDSSIFNGLPLGSPAMPTKAETKKSASDDGQHHGFIGSPAFMALLSGIGAMGTAPTVHPGVALAAGLSAGANSYLKARQVQAELGLTGAETETQKTTAGFNEQQTEANKAGIWMKNHPPPPGTMFAPGPNPDGRGATFTDWKGNPAHWAPTMAYLGAPGHAAVPGETTVPGAGVPPIPGATPSAATTPAYGHLGPAGTALTNEPFSGNTMTRFSQLAPEAQLEQQKQYQDYVDKGNAARNDLLAVDKTASALMANKDNFLAPGLLTPLKAQLVAGLSSSIDALPFINANQKEWLKSHIGADQLEAYQVAEKMAAVQAFSQVGSSQERSFQALSKALSSTPNPTMVRDAAMNLISQLRVNDQQSIDLANYLDEVSKGSALGTRNMIPSEAEAAFRKDHPAEGPGSYAAERDQYFNFLKRPTAANVIHTYQSLKDPKAKKNMADQLDARYGPNFHRYLNGGDI